MQVFKLCGSCIVDVFALGQKLFSQLQLHHRDVLHLSVQEVSVGRVLLELVNRDPEVDLFFKLNHINLRV
jgi:hypothetical protein